ncbi:MAG: hypothetical protein JO247_16475 [Chloroflexi bacterium]|nr:hypothetical protein [Chloroflexota bacterium]
MSGIKHGAARVGIRQFVPGPAFSGPTRPAPSRCDKCGGHLYLDEVELLRPFAAAGAEGEAEEESAAA